MSHHQDLLDYRRKVGEMYATLRTSRPAEPERCLQFRSARDDLFRTHPQSALTAEQKARFQGLRYYAYDPVLRFVLSVDRSVEPATFEIDLREEGLLRLRRFGKVHFQVAGRPVALALYWILGYGGGVFLPFGDLTNAETTYEGGRYLLDTIKGADLGQDGGSLILDFNYAYNPSCAYHPRWVCPLAPQENHLPVAIPAGEQRFPG